MGLQIRESYTKDEFEKEMDDANPVTVGLGSSIVYPEDADAKSIQNQTKILHTESDQSDTAEKCQVELTPNPVGNVSVDCKEHGFLGCIASADGDTERAMANAIFEVHLK